jgi:hypothetical protein
MADQHLEIIPHGLLGVLSLQSVYGVANGIRKRGYGGLLTVFRANNERGPENRVLCVHRLP